MKKTIVLLLLCLLTLSGWAQKRETRDVPTFTRINFRTPGKVLLRQGSPQKVEIEGPAEMLEEIKTIVDGNQLNIGPEKDGWNWSSWKSTDRVTVYITVREIDGLSVSGSGELIAETKITTSNLRLAVSGSGSLKVDIDAADVTANVSGSGDIEIKGKCKSLESDISGSGEVIFDATVADATYFRISGSGKVNGSGTASSMKARISGSGRVNARDLKVDTCDVTISGSGGVEIHVNKSLDANISGSGSVYYSGNPSKVNSNSSGSGKVRKL